MSHPGTISLDNAPPAGRFVCLAFVLSFVLGACSPYSGDSGGSSGANMVTVQVVDAATNAPVGGAAVTVPGQVARTNDKGVVHLATPPSRLQIRAAGHLRVELESTGRTAASIIVHLPAVTPKALYLSVYGVGDKRLRGNALKLLSETELNALVIDVKGDRGHIPYPSRVALAAQVGAQRVNTVRRELQDSGTNGVAKKGAVSIRYREGAGPT